MLLFRVCALRMWTPALLSDGKVVVWLRVRRPKHLWRYTTAFPLTSLFRTREPFSIPRDSSGDFQTLTSIMVSLCCLFSPRFIDVCFTSSRVMSEGMTSSTHHLFLSPFFRCRSEAFFFWTSPFFLPRHSPQSIVIKRAEINRHGYPDVGFSEGREKTLTNDQTVWILLDREHGCTKVTAWNAVLPEKATGTRGGSSLPTLKRSGSFFSGPQTRCRYSGEPATSSSHQATG